MTAFIEIKGFSDYIEQTPTYKKYGFNKGQNKPGYISYEGEIYNPELIHVMGELSGYCRHMKTGSFGSTHGFDHEPNKWKHKCCFIAKQMVQQCMDEAEQKYREDFPI